MAKRSLEIVIAAQNRTGQGFAAAQKGLAGLGKRILSLRNLAIGGIGIYAIQREISRGLAAWGVQEQAVNNLGAALELLGARAQLPEMEKLAADIQDVTIIGDEAVLTGMKLLASLGRLEGEGLKKATYAAIGLSRRIGKDLNTAMLLVARAAAGDTAQLTRYGIKLDATLTPQEKFNRLLEIGAESFSLATAEAETATGKLAQFTNMVGDIREELGKAFIPTVAMATDYLREHRREVEANVRAIGSWLGENAKWVYGNRQSIETVAILTAEVWGLTKAAKALVAIGGSAAAAAGGIAAGAAALGAGGYLQYKIMQDKGVPTPMSEGAKKQLKEAADWQEMVKKFQLERRVDLGQQYQRDFLRIGGMEMGGQEAARLRERLDFLKEFRAELQKAGREGQDIGFGTTVRNIEMVDEEIRTLQRDIGILARTDVEGQMLGKGVLKLGRMLAEGISSGVDIAKMKFAELAAAIESRQKELKAFAEQTIEGLKTPAQRLREELDRIEKARRAGYMGPAKAQQAAEDARWRAADAERMSREKQLADENLRLWIETTKTGLDRELALLRAAREQELAAARNEIERGLIAEKYGYLEKKARQDFQPPGPVSIAAVDRGFMTRAPGHYNPMAESEKRLKDVAKNTDRSARTSEKTLEAIRELPERLRTKVLVADF